MTIPLVKPYSLAYGAITSLECVWAKVTLDSGDVGWGESTPLPGYSDSTIDQVWRFSGEFAETCLNKDPNEVMVGPYPVADGFLFTAVWTAIENSALKSSTYSYLVPLVGLLQIGSGEREIDAVERLRKEGFKDFKTKVGCLNPIVEKKRIQNIQGAMKQGERLRIDANQGLEWNAAVQLIDVLDPDLVELLEQPFPMECWNESAKLQKISPVPIMLDESITGLESLEKAVRHDSCRMVKLKWMKQGSRRHLGQMNVRCRQLGLDVVFGNGVAGWINNWDELTFWQTELQTTPRAGEMNGFLKLCDWAKHCPMQYKSGIVSVIGQALPAWNIDDIAILQHSTLHV